MAAARSEVRRVLAELFPLRLAEKWDNVGLLIEPPRREGRAEKTVLLTNDLTEAVLEEALGLDACMIVTYHPRPFGGMKRLGPGDVTQRIAMSCVANDIWVYSPHTACDNAAGGVNDWLAQAVGSTDGATVEPVEAIEGEEGSCGRGRVITLANPVPLSEVIDNVKAHLGVPRLRFAPAQAIMTGKAGGNDAKACLEAAAGKPVKRVAVQAGSGYCVLSKVRGADLLLSGEMSHHDVLTATSGSTSVLLAEHSNSERAFLRVLQSRLSDLLPDMDIVMSAVDCDPLRSV